jgi:acetyl-CoA C-acetyltransferase
MATGGLAGKYDDVWLIDGVRTGFADYNGALGAISPIDLGIKTAREVFKRSGVNPADVGNVIARTTRSSRST